MALTEPKATANSSTTESRRIRKHLIIARTQPRRIRCEKQESRFQEIGTQERKMVRAERFELPTLWFVARYSIQLSYARTCGDADYKAIINTGRAFAEEVQ